MSPLQRKTTLITAARRTRKSGAPLEADDVALYCAVEFARTGPAGNPVQMNGRSSAILRRQADGNWLIALDNPWGADVVA